MAYTKQNFKAGQTLKAEQLNAMEEGIEKAHSLSWNDLTDKPFGTEFSVIVPETEVDIDENSEGGIIDTFNFVPDETVTITWNGTTYNCLVLDISDNMGTTCYAIGDFSVMGAEESTGEPFLLRYISDPDVVSGLVVNALDGTVSTTITLSISSNITTKIDEKYLPDKIVIEMDSSYNFTCNFTPSEIVTLFENDPTVGCVMVIVTDTKRIITPMLYYNYQSGNDYFTLGINAGSTSDPSAVSTIKATLSTGAFSISG